MPARALPGPSLAKLVMMAIPILRAAERQNPRTGPGRPPEFADWKMALLILAALIKRRKSKSAQYRYLHQHRRKFKRWLGLKFFPSRTTYFDRYRQASPLLKAAIIVQGRIAVKEGLVDPTVVAVDKTCLRAKGAPWHRHRGKPCAKPAGADPHAGWGFSDRHDWVYGYGLETVVSVTRNSLVFPLRASVQAANVSEREDFPGLVAALPARARYLLGDRWYDSNFVGEIVERRADGRRTGRRFVCPMQRRPGNVKVGSSRERGRRRRLREHRRERLAFYDSPQGRALYRQRSRIEPFHDWFKQRFELADRVWHRGLHNNQAQLLAAVFAYQLLVRYNCQHGRRNGQIQWILEQL